MAITIKDLKIPVIILVVTLITLVFAQGNLIFYDDFEDGNLNSSIWDTGATDSCTETGGVLDCTGDNDYQRTVNLETLGFNSSNPYNLTFTVTAKNYIEWYPTLMYNQPSYPLFAFDSAAVGGSGHIFGGRSTTSNNFAMQLPVTSDTATYTAAPPVTFSYIFNSTGYYLVQDHTTVLRSSTNMTLITFKYFFLGDPENGNTGDDLKISQIKLENFPPGTPDYSLTLNVGLQNGTKNYNDLFLPIYFNGSVGSSNTNSIFNCSLLVNGFYNSTLSDVNVTVNQFFNYTFPTTLENWTYFTIVCNNTESNQTSLNYYYKVDLVSPRIMSDFVNNTNFTQFDTLTIKSNFSDPNLFAYNITFFDVNGAVYSGKNYFATNLSSALYSNSTSFILTDLGNYSIKLESWDSHTGLTLKKKDEIIGNILSYGNTLFYCDNIKEMKVKKEKDKLLPEVTFNSKENQQVCYLRAKNLQKVNSNIYIHYVSLEDGIYFDEYDGRIKSEKIDNDLLKITISDSSKFDTYLSRSIGDLNYNSVVYRYSVNSESAASVDLTEITAILREISGGVSMLWIVFLYAVLIYLGFSLFKIGNYWAGWFILIMTTGFDFYFSSVLYSSLSTTLGLTILGQNTWVFIAFISLFPIAKFISMLMVQRQVTRRAI